MGTRIMVEIFDDRVEITNPGGAPKGITKDNFGSVSIARNPVIASLLLRAHYIERMGTGIERMKQAAIESQTEIPRFEMNGFFKVIFKRSPIDSEFQSIGDDHRNTSIDSNRLASKKEKEKSCGI